MKCPKCGFELEEGLLYCETCGEEIRIVPDFEPEIENSIIETLSTVAEEIGLDNRLEETGTREGDVSFGKKSSREAQQSVRGKRRKVSQGRTEERQARNGLIVSICSFLGVLFLSVVIGVQMYCAYSVPYQIDRAKEYSDQGDYAKAAAYMTKADELMPDNADIRYTLAGYCDLNQEQDKAVSILISMIQSDRYTVEEKERCYERVISILDEQGKYQEIVDLLQNSKEASLITQFQSYLAMEPEFSVPEGSYREVIPLKLSSNTSGKIYYTLNGSKPTRTSKIYTAPVFLETGDYVVSAMFVNDYGIESGIVSNSYHIDLLVPDPPEIALYSGLYVEPALIEVTASAEGEMIYYTTNGNDPTRDSTRYTGPLPMPLGRTVFKFVVISPEGVSSQVMTREFEFRLITDITISVAVRNLMYAMVDRRVLMDISGRAFGMTGYYEYRFDSLIEIPNKGLYYKMDEYFGEEKEKKEKTEHLYAVSVYEGFPNRLVYNELGEMELIPLD